MRSDKLRVFYSFALFGKEEQEAVVSVLKNHMIVGGDKTRDFESRIAALFGKNYGVLLNSGSSANLIALELLKLPFGSEIITPALSFGTTLSPIYHKGLIPAFVDVEEGTYQIDVTAVEAMISPKTRALMVPSLIGNIPDYPALRKIADKYNLWLIEDSCDTLGATINGRPTGSYTDISTTSFYASHIITAGGMGGMICIDGSSWQKRAKVLAGWGRSSARNETEDLSRFDVEIDGIPYDAKFLFEELGYNFQLSEINAAFGLAQLEKLNLHIKLRKKHFAIFLEFFTKYQDYFILPKQNPQVDTAWLAFPLVIKKSAPFKRNELIIYLEQNNIQTRPIFTGNALRQPAFKELPARTSLNNYPVADQVMEGSFMIGCHHGLTPEQINYVKKTFDTFFKTRLKPH